MTKICTSLDQSKKLIELGIDVSTADMYWWNNTEEKRYEPSVIDYGFSDMDISAWSLNALLELMPKNESLTIDLCLGGSNGMEHTFDWFCTCDENEDPYDYKTFHSDNPIDAAFEMICWLKENNKL